jgi:hypothetical protein
VLWGRPLALARARLSSSLYGKPVYSLDNDVFLSYQSYGFENTPYPVFIGDVSRSQDGVIGFYPDGPDQYSAIRCAYHAPEMPVNTDYLKYDQPIVLSTADPAEWTYCTILQESATELNLRTGILPAQQYRFLPEYTKDILEGLSFVFEVNPVLSVLDSARLPVPHENGFIWELIYPSVSEYINAGEVSPPEPLFSDVKTTLVDGYLKRKAVGKGRV